VNAERISDERISDIDLTLLHGAEPLAQSSKASQLLPLEVADCLLRSLRALTSPSTPF